MESPNPILGGTLALITGNFIGSISDRVCAFLSTKDMVVSLTGGHFQEGATFNLVDSLSSLFVQVGCIAAATEIATNAMPFMVTDSSAFTMYMMGIWSTAKGIKRNLRRINDIVLNGEMYTRQQAIKKAETSGDVPEPSQVVAL